MLPWIESQPELFYSIATLAIKGKMWDNRIVLVSCGGIFFVSSLNDEVKEYNESDYTVSHAKSTECLSIEDNASLFRAIGESEFYSVMRTKRFSFWHRSAKVKYFANEFEETIKFANKAFATEKIKWRRYQHKFSQQAFICLTQGNTGEPSLCVPRVLSSRKSQLV